AEALGGRSRIQSLRTLTIVGYGQIGQQNGGGNIDPHPYAPQKWTNVGGSTRTIDLQNGRMRLVQTATQDFVFAYERNMRGIRSDVRLDGDIAWNIGANGAPQRVGDAASRARRLDMLNNPIALVRAALDPAATLSNLRTDRASGAQAIDVTTAKGDQLTIGFDTRTRLPAWVSWVQPDTNLGEVTLRTYYTAYQAENGVQVPFGYTSVIDWRNTVTWRFYVDRVLVDAPTDDLTAPAAVRVPAPPPAAPTIQVENVAKGIWYLRGQGNSTAFEFSDHIVLYEVYASEANARAIIEKARTLVPGKPVTRAIVSHHHFDHSGGLRAAVAEGLEIITHRGNVEIFREMAGRPAKTFPDALGRSPRPIRLLPVDETLVLKDAVMEVQIYRTLNNSHMANAVIAYAPGAKTVSQGDLVDENWDLVYWGNSYPETVNFWKLDVERDLAVHGRINTYRDAIGHLRRQAANAKAFCEKAAAANFSVPGCPVTNADF
ncbi:MAG: MBL fold metallo-hydrolase, partial [Acidimicrobiia bacterium]|nr:MBL fold metallo-hydrolase [Acidimicrobiia bacterium]